MRKTFLLWGGLISLVGFLLPVHAQVAPDLSFLGSGTHLYLRCNSTSWDVNEKSRLKLSEPEFLREITVEVKEAWMTSTGDDCVLTETPQLDAWGAWQKYYGGQQSDLRVPGSTYLRAPGAPHETMNFKLRFPALGRYRLSLNTRDGYFSIRSEAAAQPGDVTWTLPGNTLTDSLGRLFLSSSYPQNSLSLVNGDSGLPIWTYKAENYISFYGTCSTAEAIFVSLPDRVASISVKTGREVWSTDLGGALKGAYGYLSCHPGQDQIYLAYGSERTTLVSLQAANGKALWSWAAPAYASIMGVDAQRVFVGSFQDAGTTVRALQKSTGAELWTAVSGNGYVAWTEDGSLFWVNGSEVTALSPGNGRAVWTYKGQPQDSLWLTFEQNGFIVHEKARISSLDKKSGRVLWTYDYGRFAELSPYAQILKSGVALIRANDYTAGVSYQIALNNAAGKVLWEREEASTSSYLSEDNLAGTWLINGKSIGALDPWTGKLRWTYTLDSVEPWENIMGVLEQDRTTVYVAYGFSNSKYPPMGVLALDAKTGHVKWKNWMESPVSRVGGDSRSLILNAGYSGSTKALRK